jgi:hypothetical protein
VSGFKVVGFGVVGFGVVGFVSFVVGVGVNPSFLFMKDPKPNETMIVTSKKTIIFII